MAAGGSISRTRVWPGRLARLAIVLAAALVVLVPLVVTTQPLLPDVAVGPPVFPAKLEAHVRALASEPRSSQDAARLDAVADQLAQAFAASGAAVTEQPFVPAHTKTTYRNVIARFGPATDEVVVVGAHYDSVEGSPGADDDATGIAALLELAPLLSKARLQRSVELVAYSLGEPPYFGTVDMGSAHHARSLSAQRKSVRGALVLEMLGYYSVTEGSQRYASLPLRALYPSRGDFVSVVGRHADWRLTRDVKRALGGAMDVPVRSLNGPRRFGVDASDQQSYWANGYAAVMITDTGAARNPHTHTPGDTPDTIDYRRLAKTVSALYVAILALAG